MDMLQKLHQLRIEKFEKENNKELEAIIIKYSN